MILGPWFASRREYEEARLKAEEAQKKMDAEIERLIADFYAQARPIHGKEVQLLLDRAIRYSQADRTQRPDLTYEQGILAGLEFVQGVHIFSLFLGKDQDSDITLDDVLALWPGEKDKSPYEV